MILPSPSLISKTERLVSAHPDDIVAMYGLDEICVYGSPSHEPILGYTSGEMPGHHWHDFIAPEDHAHASLAGTDALLNGRSIRFTFYAATKSGDRIRLRGRAWIAHDPETNQPFLTFQASVVHPVA